MENIAGLIAFGLNKRGRIMMVQGGHHFGAVNLYKMLPSLVKYAMKLKAEVASQVSA